MWEIEIPFGTTRSRDLSFDLPEEGLDLQAYRFQIEKHFYELALERPGGFRS
ncbi:MAG: hypothetical protein ACOC47_04905 [Alkalispirochaetaceae bacterium]